MGLPRQILLLGPPGAGKGTQAKRISQHLNLAYCSTGSILRVEEQRRTSLGEEIHTFLKDGNFVPDALILKIVQNWLQAVRAEFVLDGFPRTLAQGSALDQFLAESHRPAATAVYLDVPMDILEERVAHRVGCDPCGNVWPRETAPVACPECGNAVVPRNDDSIDLYRSRLAEYEKKTLPLLPYYEDGDRLRRISGQGSPDDVFARVLDALAS